MQRSRTRRHDVFSQQKRIIILFGAIRYKATCPAVFRSVEILTVIVIIFSKTIRPDSIDSLVSALDFLDIRVPTRTMSASSLSYINDTRYRRTTITTVELLSEMHAAHRTDVHQLRTNCKLNVATCC